MMAEHLLPKWVDEILNDLTLTMRHPVSAENAESVFQTVCLWRHCESFYIAIKKPSAYADLF